MANFGAPTIEQGAYTYSYYEPSMVKVIPPYYVPILLIPFLLAFLNLFHLIYRHCLHTEFKVSMIIRNFVLIERIRVKI